MSDDLTIAYQLGVEDMRSKLHKQADEIERLRAENETLREALRIFVWTADELFADERYQKLLKAADKIMESGDE
jgi:regulator of replication initiation timing